MSCDVWPSQEIRLWPAILTVFPQHFSMNVLLPAPVTPTTAMITSSLLESDVSRECAESIDRGTLDSRTSMTSPQAVRLVR